MKKGDHPGFIEVDRASAQMGDIVVQGGHAGVFMTESNGDVWAWANNGRPSSSPRGYTNSSTGPRKFNNGSFGSGDPRFFRPLVEQP
jgi:hypothetical protein